MGGATLDYKLLLVCTNIVDGWVGEDGTSYGTIFLLFSVLYLLAQVKTITILLQRNSVKTNGIAEHTVYV